EHFSFNNPMIDLFLVNEHGQPTHLFEIKIDQATTNLYGAVGQLMIHGALKGCTPHRILVVPGKLSIETSERLRRLRVRVLTYHWQGDMPVFDNLTAAIR